MKTGNTGSGKTVGDACRAVIENGTATLSPDIVERIGKAEVKLSAVSALMGGHGITVVALREHVRRLHAERGGAVLDAKKSREEQGFKSAAFQLDWQHVEDLTRAIVHYESELEKALAAGTPVALAAAAAERMRKFGVPEGVTTVVIEHGTAALGDGTVGAVAKTDIPLLRDPDVEMPDDGFHVVAVTDDETESVVLAYHDADSWLDVDGDSVLDGSVVGWCWQDEAAEVLKKAVRNA